MTPVLWVILAVVVVVVGWVILQPQRWGKRDSGGSDGGTSVGVDGTGRRNHDNDGDGNDGDGGGDGGGGD